MQVQGRRSSEVLGKRVPGRSDGAALGRHRRGVQELERQARDLLPPDREDPRRVGHRRQRAGMVFGNMGDTSATGVAFTRNPGHRREQVLRRMAGQRPGRRRGGRHPHAAARSTKPPRTSRTSTCRASRRRCPRSTSELDDIRRSSSSTTTTCRTSSSRSRKERFHAAVPHRQADRHRRREHGHGHARGEADRRRRTP